MIATMKRLTITTTLLVVLSLSSSSFCFTPGPTRFGYKRTQIHPFTQWRFRTTTPPQTRSLARFMNFGLVPPPEKTQEKTATTSSRKTSLAIETAQEQNDETPLWNFLSSSSSNVGNTVQDMERFVGKESDGGERNIFPLGIAALLASGVALANGLHLHMPSILDSAQAVLANPTDALERVVESIQSMGNVGLLYFGVAYTVAEILAIPAIPLTASAGYLFGVQEGTAVVLLCASVAAAISFGIGRTLLRGYVEGILEDYPQMRKIDKAIGKEGFKLMLLLRLSPIFPFALSNYLYGATSVRFWPYFFGTMLGFTPGTIAYVYTGEVGKALTLGGDETQPWYVYAGAFALLGAFLKVGADVASNIISELEDEEPSP